MDKQEALPRVLVYQDEDCRVLVEYLNFCGFGVIETTEENVLAKIQEGKYDICIIDRLNAYIKDNFKLLRIQRKVGRNKPVIFLSNISDYSYIIEAFKLGTDDYVTRPYNLEELVCRIKALLKRSGIKSRKIEATYEIGNYVFDTKLKRLELKGVEIKLTIIENKVLALLCAYQNELLTKEILMRDIWGDDNFYNRRSLDVHICRLRNHLKQDNNIKIETIRGLGYSLTVYKD